MEAFYSWEEKKQNSKELKIAAKAISVVHYVQTLIEKRRMTTGEY